MFQIATGDQLVDYIKAFTGSVNNTEIKQCIFLAEMSMRNIELPALRSDPYAPENIGVVDQNGNVPIPGDMNKPILFFKQGQSVATTATATGNSNQYTITLTTTPPKPLQVGMLVTGLGIGVNATISLITGNGIGSQITLTMPNTAAVNGLVAFATTGQQSSQTGPWIVYDRIGDRDIITQGMIAQLYLQPVNVPAVIRGKFSEVAQKYKFLPYVAQGDLINLYYFKAWPTLFSPVTDELISSGGIVGTIVGKTAHITAMSSTVGLSIGDQIRATPAAGSLGSGTITVTAIISANEITISTSSNGLVAGNVGDISLTNLFVQNNPVLSSWPEGYVYGTLREYYIKRHNDDDAAVYDAKFKEAWNVIEDQNNLGKWSGGHTRLTSVWQPRQYRQYNIK